MSLDMQGHVDAKFESIPVVRIKVNGRNNYVNGILQPTDAPDDSQFIVNVQKASDRQIETLARAGKRVLDVRNLYVNNGDIESITEQDDWEFLNQRWQTVGLDNRPWRNYCKVVVSRYDT